MPSPPMVTSEGVECCNHEVVQRFESHLLEIGQKLDRCLKGIADNEGSLNALRQQAAAGVASVDSPGRPNLFSAPESDPLVLSFPSAQSPSSQGALHARESRLSLSSTACHMQFDEAMMSQYADPNLHLGGKVSISELMRARRERLGHSSGSSQHLWSRSLTSLSEVIVATMPKKQRKRSKFAIELWKVLDEPGSSREATLAGKASSLLICMSVILTLLDSGLNLRLGVESVIIQLVCDVIFSIELLARFYCCPSRTIFLTEVYTFCEIIACFPILVVRLTCNLGGPLDPDTWPYIVLVAFTPVLRLLMLLRRFEQIHLQFSAFWSAAEALPVMLCTLLILITGFAAILFAVEPRSNVPSFEDALWMTSVTCFTVGYGDMLPRSTRGRFVVGCLMVFSALYMAIPIGIVGNAFSRVWAERESRLLVRRMTRRLRIAKIGGDNIAALFYMFDKDRNGLISRTEFLDIIKSMSVNLDDAQALQLFDIIDVDGSGEISDEEFVKVLFPSDFKKISAALSSVVDITKQVATSAMMTASETVHRVSASNPIRFYGSDGSKGSRRSSEVFQEDGSKGSRRNSEVFQEEREDQGDI